MSKDLILSYLCKCVLNKGRVSKGRNILEESFVEYHLNGIVVVGKAGFKIDLLGMGTRYLTFKRTFDTNKLFSFAELLDVFKSVGFVCTAQGWPASGVSNVNGQAYTFRKVSVTPPGELGRNSFLQALNVWEEVDQITAVNEVQESIKCILDSLTSNVYPGVQVTVKNHIEKHLNLGPG